MALYGRYSDIPQLTWTVQAGAADANFPIANLNNRFSHSVCKSTGTTITFRGTGSSVTLEGFAFINTQATAIQLTNGAGLSQAVSIPATPLDGHHLDPVIDLRGLANTTSTTWDIALTGPTGVALGVPVPIITLRTLYIQWSPTPIEEEEHRSTIEQTHAGVRLKYGYGVRQRGARGLVRRDTAKTDILALQRDARGALRNFVLILDDDINDALWVDLVTDVRRFLRLAPGGAIGGSPVTVAEDLYDVPVEFLEQQKGLALT